MKKFIVVLLLVSMASVASAELLLNPGFETEGVGGALDAANWTELKMSAPASGHLERSLDASHSGVASMTMYDTAGLFVNGAIMQQVPGYTIGENDIFELSLWNMIPTGADPAQMIVSVQINGGSTVIRQDWLTLSDNTPDIWEQDTLVFDISQLDQAIKDAVVGTVPMVRVYARISADSAVNKLYFDDTSLTVVPEPATLALLGLGAFVLRRRKV